MVLSLNSEHVRRQRSSVSDLTVSWYVYLLINYNKLKLTVTGHINLHKGRQASTPESSADITSLPSWPQARAFRRQRQHSGPFSGKIVYTQERGQSSKLATHARTYRHRSLILNQKDEIKGREDEVENLGDAGSSSDYQFAPMQRSAKVSSAWITKRDRHMQLISASIYEKETKSRKEAIDATRQLKLHDRSVREKQKIKKHIQVTTGGRTLTAPTAHFLLIDGLRFHVCSGGSRLVRERCKQNFPCFLPC